MSGSLCFKKAQSKCKWQVSQEIKKNLTLNELYGLKSDKATGANLF